jgi:hypothetical protein
VKKIVLTKLGECGQILGEVARLIIVRSRDQRARDCSIRRERECEIRRPGQTQANLPSRRRRLHRGDTGLDSRRAGPGQRTGNKHGRRQLVRRLTEEGGIGPRPAAACALAGHCD